ncbi:MAG: hypothetical protein ABJF10_02515 [Chthoniobacter sp.]|uniref:TolB family protein n=1 Tax=Chthoniobacter sp. TaxID=2510640 RepID=UPI0032A257DF
MPPKTIPLLLALLSTALPLRAETPEDPLAPWRSGVTIKPVAPDQQRHSIHTYFNLSPESPDGKWVLFYTSTAVDGQHGEVRIRNRASGEERVLVENLDVEDAHRAACQQWICKGKSIAYHGERNGEWFVGVTDLDTGKERIHIPGRLSCWGQPNGDLVPLYGPHWNPGPHRDLELLNAATGEIQTVLTADAARAAYPDWFAKQYGDQPVSIFFPILSPDASKVFFKLASNGHTNGNPRSKGASAREGLICYNIAEKRFLFLRSSWGHPAWCPDGTTIVNTAFTLIDSNTGKENRVPGLPVCRGDHPSASPDGKLLITDSTMDKFEGKATDWGIFVADARGNSHVVIDQFDNSHGARSWRVSHPHPVFSPDGKRIYFNVSSGQWTQLYVAERQ